MATRLDRSAKHAAEALYCHRNTVIYRTRQLEELTGLRLSDPRDKLLLTLVERRGRVQSRPQLLETVWEAQPDIQTRTVDMHVQRLRTKLGVAGELIETVRGFGYRFRGPERSGRRA